VCVVCVCVVCVCVWCVCVWGVGCVGGGVGCVCGVGVWGCVGGGGGFVISDISSRSRTQMLLPVTGRWGVSLILQSTEEGFLLPRYLCAKRSV